MKLNHTQLIQNPQIRSNILKYVDDTKVISKWKNPDDIQNIQNQLNVIYKWQEHNNMAWNPDKFQLLIYGNRDLSNQNLLFTPIYDNPIYEVDIAKDFGIQMDSNFDFDFITTKQYPKQVTNVVGYLELSIQEICIY